MKFSIIIPTFHRNELLEHCLKRLVPELQEVAATSYQVIVSDDGRTSSAEYLIREKFSWMRWIKGPGRGPAANRNNGAAVSEGEWLLFTDDDCLPDSGWIKAYEDAIREHPGVKVFEGRSYPDKPRDSFSQCAPVNEKGGFLPSCNFLIYKQVFQELAGFDEDYGFSFEDMDFHYRLKRSGHKIVFIEDAAVCHPWRNVTKAASKSFFQHQFQGIRMFITKHPEVIHSFNSKHFLATSFSALFFHIVPGLITYRGRGLRYALQNMFFKLKMAYIFLPKTLQWYFRKQTDILKNALRAVQRV